MTNFFNSPGELLYAWYGASTNLATFTAEDNLMKTFPACPIPNLRQTLSKVGLQSSSLKVKARGQGGTSGTPTFTFSLRLITSETWSAGGLLLGSSSAVPAASTVLLSTWELEADIGLVTLPAAGVTATVKTVGSVNGALFPNDGAIPANNVSPSLATLDLSAQYYLWLSAACSASNSLNLINCQMFKLYCEN